MGQPIASCLPIRKKGAKFLRFVIPFLGRFTAAEILYETVTIVARTDRGDTGVIKMEGAARFELTRIVLGTQLDTVLDVDFTRNGNARPNLGEGWSVAEDDFTCTLNDNSFIHFPSPPAQGTYTLRLRFSTFIWDTLPVQALETYVNETQVDVFTTVLPGIVFHEISFAGAVFATTADSAIRLYHPGAGRYCDHYETTDARRLAFAFRRISLGRAVPPLTVAADCGLSRSNGRPDGGLEC